MDTSYSWCLAPLLASWLLTTNNVRRERPANNPVVVYNTAGHPAASTPSPKPPSPHPFVCQPAHCTDLMAESSDAGYPDMASQVQNVVAAAIAESSTEDHQEEFKASICVAWELLQYIQTREKLGQESSLGQILTVTAKGPSHAWAVSCREYVETTWGDIGVLFLERLEEELLGCMLSIRFDSQGKPKPQTCFNACTPYANDTSGRSCDFDLGSVDDEIAGRPASVTFWGTWPEICALGQFVSWIAATFRLPQAGGLAASRVFFEVDAEASESTRTKRFRIRMENLTPGGDDDASPPAC